MILKKLMISYYSDNLNNTKKMIVEVLKNYGIFDLELIEDFTNNELDFDNNTYTKSYWQIIFYLPKNRFFNDKLNQINLDLGEISDDFVYDIYEKDLDTDTYKDEWKKSFTTSKITDRITINPSWINYEAKKEDEIVIKIDPSIAFGTGTHETTSLCIDFLEKYAKDKKRLLDIGCGSGILMLVANKLGVAYVAGIDIDKNCYDVVRNNAKINDIDNYDVYIGNLVDKIDGKYDIVVSNILVDVLEKLLKDIEKVITKDSILIFSGILEEKEFEFLKKAEQIGLTLIDKKYKNKWVSLVFKGEPI